MLQSTSLPNLTGRTVEGGRLQIVTLLGAGAYGKLYRAIDTNPTPRSRPYSWPGAFPTSSNSSISSSSSASPNIYAVKCLVRPPPRTKDAKIQRRERSLHLRVSSHPNIVTLHRHFTDKSHCFLVMDYHPRGDLFQAITEDVYFRKPELIKATFAAIVQGVQFCHNKGVYHRDIKPDNILVDFDGCSPCLADFGLATSHKVSREADCGTGSYMSPETFASSGTVCYRPALSDAWALSITLINLVTAMNPWHAARPLHDSRFRSFIRQPDYYLLNILPISSDLSAVLVRTFHLDPTVRLPLAQFADEVQKIDDLFISEEELEFATPAVRRAAGYVVEGEEFDPSEPIDDAEPSNSGSGYSSDLRPLPAGLLPRSPSPSPPAAPGHQRKPPRRSASDPSNSSGRACVLTLDLPRSVSSSPQDAAVPKLGKFKRFMRRLRVWRK
ncbi:kinase-like domain-containing protein [Roridomyces roridus]|uniref:non-specific serine/threonine protein kinase n=1 Tax=Roridomyces roridus TaxID=1738132 RepID=A0AAD7C5I6_9AGAR|nr:kinase-like domain-containing protein [Roridomyces roridus]